MRSRFMCDAASLRSSSYTLSLQGSGEPRDGDVERLGPVGRSDDDERGAMVIQEYPARLRFTNRLKSGKPRARPGRDSQAEWVREGTFSPDDFAAAVTGRAMRNMSCEGKVTRAWKGITAQVAT